MHDGNPHLSLLEGLELSIGDLKYAFIVADGEIFRSIALIKNNFCDGCFLLPADKKIIVFELER